MGTLACCAGRDPRARSYRARTATIPCALRELGGESPKTPINSSAWRRYYSVRNATLIAREHAELHRTTVLVALRAGLGGRVPA